MNDWLTSNFQSFPGIGTDMLLLKSTSGDTLLFVLEKKKLLVQNKSTASIIGTRLQNGKGYSPKL